MAAVGEARGWGSFEDAGVIPAECLGAGWVDGGEAPSSGAQLVRQVTQIQGQICPEGRPGSQQVWRRCSQRGGFCRGEARGKRCWGEAGRASQGVGAREGVGADLEALGTALSLAGPPQTAKARHAMQFPTELTKKACRTGRRELRLICMYFFNTRFFPVSAVGDPAGWRWPLPGGAAASMPLPGFWVGTSPLCNQNRHGLSPGLSVSRMVGGSDDNVQMRPKKPTSVCACP